MFDFSWSELALIGVVALVAIGPKDLPKALRTAGTWARKARTISREFQSSIEQMIREAELDEVKKEVEKVTAINLEEEVKSAVDPGGTIAESLKAPDLPDLHPAAERTSTEQTPSPSPPSEAPAAVAPPREAPVEAAAPHTVEPVPEPPAEPAPPRQGSAA
jgi:sec-independent protein translocase protein TatB